MRHVVGETNSFYFVRMSIRNLKASKIMSWLTRCWSRWTKGLFVRSSSIVLWQVVFKVLLDSLLLLWIWHCEWHKNWVGKLVNLCELQFSFSARRHSDPKLAKKYSWPTQRLERLFRRQKSLAINEILTLLDTFKGYYIFHVPLETSPLGSQKCQTDTANTKCLNTAILVA